MKRIDQLRDLSDDHHTGLVLARHCKQAGRPELGAEAVWEQVLSTFPIHLEPHFQIEEQHLLPALTEIGEEALATQIRAEHTILRSLRQSTDTSLTLVHRFGELLEAHIRFEERQVFEATQHRLPADTLQAIASACQTIPRTCPAFLET